MLIWRLTEPPRPGADIEAPWMTRSETFANVRASVDTWLGSAALGLVKAGLYRLQGFGDRRAFACSACKEVIKSSWVSALPPAKWALIAEASVASAEAREALFRKLAAQSVPAEEKPRPPLPSQLSEADWRFIGPRRKPYRMTETVDAAEDAQRLASKEAYAARCSSLGITPDTGSVRTDSGSSAQTAAECSRTTRREGTPAGPASNRRAGDSTGGSRGRHRGFSPFASTANCGPNLARN